MSKQPIPLLPCLWCGSDDLELDYNDQNIYVQCQKCWATGPWSEKDEAETIAVWNKGPYADRHEIHAAALKAHAEKLRAKAAEHLAKADELLAKAGGKS